MSITKNTLIIPDNIYFVSNIFKELDLYVEGFSKIFIVTDENLLKYYAELSTLPYEIITIASGDKSKNFTNLEFITESILAHKPDRESVIVSFGGGVIGDIAGLSASILLRGIKFIQIPTTLMSMVDSSIGGKTAINSKFGKNLIGSFHNAHMILYSLDLLNTLPNREYFSAYSEIVKYGLIYDSSFLLYLENNIEKILTRDKDFLKNILYNSIAIKSRFTNYDMYDLSVRNFLNLGHTIGHAIEIYVNSKNIRNILHGEAVSIGIILACKLSKKMGYLKSSNIERIEKIFRDINLPTNLYDIHNDKWDLEELMNYILHDKKIKDNKINFILPLEEGGAIKHQFDNINMIKDFLTEVLY